MRQTDKNAKNPPRPIEAMYSPLTKILNDRRHLHLSCYNDNDDDNKMNLETSINLVDVFDDDTVFKYS